MNDFSKYFLILLVLILPIKAMADQITVAGAANVQFNLEDLKIEFTKETGIGVKVVIGSSGKLTAQIENGAPFDVFMSADVDYPKRLYTDGMVVEQPRIYAYGALVLWTFNDIDLSKGIAGLADGSIKKIAIALPRSAPYGFQAVNAMKYNHLYPSIETKLVYAESIAQVNQFITTRVADVGITAKSVVLAQNMQGKGKWVDVGQDSYTPIAQAVVVLRNSRNNQSADKFYQFLFSPKAQEIFKQYGYTLP